MIFTTTGPPALTYDSIIGESVNSCVSFLQENKRQNKIKPDIIFIDYHLSDLNGLSAAKILKQTWKKTKIVLISNEFSLNKIRNPKKYGIDLLCAKSSDFDQFIAQIKQLQFKHIVSIFLKSTLISLSLITLYFLATLKN